MQRQEETTDLVVVDPVTLEAIPVAGATSDVLARLVMAIKQREHDYKQWRQNAEQELLHRLSAEGRRVATVGDYEIRLTSGKGRVWDATDLEAALRDLVDRGTLQAGELTGVITHETKVDGRRMQRLLESLQGAARAKVEACFRWEQKGRGRLEVAESIQLVGPED